MALPRLARLHRDLGQRRHRSRCGEVLIFVCFCGVFGLLIWVGCCLACCFCLVFFYAYAIQRLEGPDFIGYVFFVIRH